MLFVECMTFKIIYGTEKQSSMVTRNSFSVCETKHDSDM